MTLSTLDRYLLGRTLPPMTAVLISTMVAFLMERLLRSFDLLAQTNRGSEFLFGLIVNLAPHYLGLTLPGGFFIGLFVVINRLNKDAEIDAILASGVSLGRLAAPLVGLGLIFMLLSVVLYGFVQPYSRYGYRAVLHAAENAGWNGEVLPQAVLSPGPDLIFTAESTDPTGQRLERVFIRRLAPDGQEDVLTAASATIHRDRDTRSVMLDLTNGQQLSTMPQGGAHLLTFTLFSVRLPLAPTARLLRSRGGEETELTLLELAQQGFGRNPPALPRQAILAELYSRIARAIILPLMPLLAVPFGLTGKRAGSAPAIAVGGLLLFVFQGSLIFAQGMAGAGLISGATAVGWPTAAFATACIATFVASRSRPGQNPVNWFAESIGEAIAFFSRQDRAAAAQP